MRKLGKKQLTLQLQARLAAAAAVARDSRSRAARDGGWSSSTPTIRKPSAPASQRCLRRSREAGIRFKDLQTTQSSLEEIFVSLVEETRMNWHAVRAIYKFEMARTVAHDLPEHRSPGALDVAVLRRVRLRDRLAHPRDRRHRATARSSCRA